MKCIRQGDILLVEVDKKPIGVTTKHAQLTIALGEATGHHHTLYAQQGMLATDAPRSETAPYVEEFFDDKKRFIKIDTAWVLRHQEHDHLEIPAGTYEIITEREYDPFEEEMKKVID